VSKEPQKGGDGGEQRNQKDGVVIPVPFGRNADHANLHPFGEPDDGRGRAGPLEVHAAVKTEHQHEPGKRNRAQHDEAGDDDYDRGATEDHRP
jgi:hypothetical protein